MSEEYIGTLEGQVPSALIEREAAHQHLVQTIGVNATNFLFGDKGERASYIMDAVVEERARMRAEGTLYGVGENGKEHLNPLDLTKIGIRGSAITRVLVIQRDENQAMLDTAADTEAAAVQAEAAAAAKEARTIDAKKPFKPEGPLVGFTPPASHEELWARREDARLLPRVHSGEMIRRIGDVPVGEEFTVGGDEGRGGQRFADTVGGKQTPLQRGAGNSVGDGLPD